MMPVQPTAAAELLLLENACSRCARSLSCYYWRCGASTQKYCTGCVFSRQMASSLAYASKPTQHYHPNTQPPPAIEAARVSSGGVWFDAMPPLSAFLQHANRRRSPLLRLPAKVLCKLLSHACKGVSTEVGAETGMWHLSLVSRDCWYACNRFYSAIFNRMRQWCKCIVHIDPANDEIVIRNEILHPQPYIYVGPADEGGCARVCACVGDACWTEMLQAFTLCARLWTVKAVVCVS